MTGPLGPRFMIVSAVRVTGHVDLAVLQGALDDVVERHELLRTLVVRDADPPYQQVLPPCQVPLEVRDLPPVTGKSRDMVVHELILEVEAGIDQPARGAVAEGAAVPIRRPRQRPVPDRASLGVGCLVGRS